MNGKGFAGWLLAALVKLDSRASALQARARGRAALIGVEDEGEFVPLVRLAAPSTRYNVMSLFVNHHGRWQPTLKRGTPQQLAEELAGPLQHVWVIPLAMTGPWRDPGEPVRSSCRRAISASASTSRPRANPLPLPRRLVAPREKGNGNDNGNGVLRVREAPPR